MSFDEGEGGGLMRGDKNTSATLCTKNAGGGLMREGGHICGTLRYIFKVMGYGLCITFKCAEVKIDTRLDESSLLTRGSMWWSGINVEEHPRCQPHLMHL